MKLTLRTYQEKAIEDIRDAFRSGANSVLLQCPTGAGKSLIMAYMAKSALEKGNAVYFVVHRDYLMTQASQTLSIVDVPHGMISPAYAETQHMIQVASVMTLVRRLDRVRPGDLIIIDEAHRSLASSHLKVAKHWPKARIVGLTASPRRLDGKPLGDVYQTIVKGPSMRWLIDNGFLSDFIIYAPPSPGLDMSGVKNIGGDFDRGESEKRVNKPTITGSAVEHYKKLLSGKRAVVFCTSIKHSLAVVEQFNAAGIPAAHIDGTFDRERRRQVIGDFESGRIKILSNVELVVEGFDLPAVEGVILLRPTQSLVFFLQSIGRALRPALGKTHATILDHVGACARHGFPDDEHEWTLSGAEESGRKNNEGPLVRITQCNKCYFVFESGPQSCPKCGGVAPVKTREIKVEDGELKRLTREAMEEARRQSRREVGTAKTLDDLISIGKQRGYKNPQYWAQQVHGARSRKVRA